MPRGGVWEERPTLTVWVYDSVLGAAAGQVRLDALSRRGSVDALDAVTVTWVPGAHRPRISSLRLPAVGSAADSVLGRLVLLLTADPPDALREVAARLAGSGIDEPLLADLRAALVPGHSALLVHAVSADLDAVRAVIERGRARGDVTLFHAYLTPEAPSVLERALGTSPERDA